MSNGFLFHFDNFFRWRWRTEMYDWRERVIYILVSRTLMPYLDGLCSIIHSMGTRTGTFCKDDEDSEKKSHRYLTIFRMLVTDWPGKISGISCKSDCCDGCVMFQLCRSGLFLRLSGWMPMAIWESWTESSIWARMISSLITFSIQKQMSLLNRWAPSRKIVLCSSQ